MKKIYHCADVHLGASSKFISNLLDVQLRTLEKISIDAAKNRISAIVIAGDLFDSPHVPSSIVESFRELVSKNIQVNYVLISGTHGHDSYENERSIFKRSIFKSFPANFYFLDSLEQGFTIIDDIAFYSPTHVLSSMPAADHHVLAFHGVSDEVQDFLSKSSVRRYDYIALGHFHYFDSFTIGKSSASYSGSLLAFEWPKGKKGVNESTYAEIVFDGNEVTVNKKYSSDVKMIRSYISESRHLDEIGVLLTSKTWLKLWGKPQFKEEADSRFRAKVNSFEYKDLETRELPEMLIEAIDQLVQQQTDEHIPWDMVKETALRLLSGEEGIDFINPDKHLRNLEGGK